jgi:hypothetical protein
LICTVDCGTDHKKLLESLLDGRRSRFVICLTGERTVLNRRGRLGSVAEAALRCRLRYRAHAGRIDKV